MAMQKVRTPELGNNMKQQMMMREQMMSQAFMQNQMAQAHMMTMARET